MATFVADGSPSSTPPPAYTTLLLRERAGLVVYTGPPSITPEDDSKPFTATPVDVPSVTGASVRLAPLYSTDGTYLALAKDTIALCSPAGAVVSEVPCTDNSWMAFSPKSSFLMTWSKPVTTSSGSPAGNLKIWDTSSGQMVTSFFQKNFKRDAVQFTADERYCCRSVSNEVHILTVADFSTASASITAKVHHKGVTQFRIAPVPLTDGSFVVAVFNAETGGNPARAGLYKYSPAKGTVDGPVSTRTMFAASEASMMFNSSGTALLVHTQCDVDHSNRYEILSHSCCHFRSQLVS